MNLGDTFLIREADINDHLQVVISDPKKDADRVLIVSITSYKPHKESVVSQFDGLGKSALR